MIDHRQALVNCLKNHWRHDPETEADLILTTRHQSQSLAEFVEWQIGLIKNRVRETDEDRSSRDSIFAREQQARRSK